MNRKTNRSLCLILCITLILAGSNFLSAELSRQEKQKLKEAGDALSEFSTMYYVGFGLEVGGVGLGLISALAGEPSIAVGGGLCFLTGWICDLIAPSKVAKAGRALKELGNDQQARGLSSVDYSYKVSTNYDLHYRIYF